MREIIFRGKRVENGEWVYGAYLPKHKLICLEETKPNSTEYIDLFVIPETVGQYTGLTDKNGKKIFEGDIVLCRIVGFREMKINKGFIEYTEDAFGVNINGITPTQHCLSFSMKNGDVEVIGNIHDNPELLKGGVNNE
jgi:uncharacterized phage protein (TIGR01671 family)